ncbi:carbohydrate-binding protein [Archangium sp.]|uniref:carbohydrate-binding protein n=1 Tax=Archangium sp. TaxID=1872627 RepID=UPI00286A87FC|nr:carbohydrate-binding protein [Archangium sp.]
MLARVVVSFASLLLVLTLAGCPEQRTPPEERDAGGGPVSDAGTEPDAGTPSGCDGQPVGGGAPVDAPGDSQGPRLDEDGRRVVFASKASTLVVCDTNAAEDIFLHDTGQGTTRRLSVSPGGTQANGGSSSPDISGDGRLVVFASRASNLVPGDTNGHADIFLLDLKDGRLERVSLAPNGAQANGASTHPRLSADGRFIAFESEASNLVAGDTNGQRDVFLLDLEARQVRRVSLGSGGAEANGASTQARLSEDGGAVSFLSSASNLVAGDTNARPDVFVHELDSGTTTHVGVGVAVAHHDLSRDGRWVAVVPDASAGLFLYECATGTTTQVTTPAGGTPRASRPVLSADNRYVLFDSPQDGLVAGDVNGVADVFLHDRHTGALRRVSVEGSGAELGGGASEPAFSGDGTRLAFGVRPAGGAPRLHTELSGTGYYVATDGLDTHPGTPAQPFRTVGKAAQVAGVWDTVYVRAGTYRETVIPARSGAEGKPLVFRPFAGESVTLSGADVLTGWTQVGGGVWRASMPWNFTSDFQSNQVFLDGRMLELARWPDETNGDRVANPYEATMDEVSFTDGLTVVTDAEFTDAPERWVGARVWVNLSRNGHDGQGQTGTVVSAGEGTLTLQGIDTRGGNQPWGVGPGTRYYLFDPTAEAVGASGGAAAAVGPGEWWLDVAAEQLYVHPLDGAAPGKVEARRRSWAFDLSGLSHVTVRGLRLFATSLTTDNQAAGRTSTVAPASHIVLEKLEASYVTHFTDQAGNYQMQWLQKSGLILSGSDLVLRDSTVRLSAGSCVSVIGRRNRVLHNVLRDCNYSVSEAGALNTGRTYAPGPTTSLDHELAYNTLFHTPQQGINFRALRNSTNSPTDIRARIHHNVLHDVMLRSHDSAALDTFGTDHQHLRIDHNVIYNVSGPTNFGIYFDFASKGVVDHNLVFDVRQPLNINWTDPAKPQQMRVYNNTGLSDRPSNSALSSMGSTSPGSDIRNNLLSGALFTASDAIVSHNLVSSGALYVDALQGDFQLAASATAAIDQGVSVAPFDDPTSGGAPDLGALEHGRSPWRAGSRLRATSLAAPAQLTVTPVGSTQVDLTWTDTTDDEEAFLVLRSADKGLYWHEVARLAPGTTRYSDTTVPGGRFLYRVRTERSPGSNAVLALGRSAQATFQPGLYDAQSGGLTVFGDNALGGSRPGSWIRFNGLDFGAPGSVWELSAHFSSGTVGSQVQVWLDDPVTGTKVGAITVEQGDWVYRTLSTPITDASGVHDVFLEFTHWGTANMAWFRFTGDAPTQVPEAPSALAASVSSSAVLLTWRDNATLETEFKVERSADGVRFFQVGRAPANATGYQDTPAGSGTWHYRVRAANLAGNSPFTHPVRAAVP